jgi:2-polyprenyl-3-methyl-5-hydroxy-6-metoxy-1,4-benzoquinol methylase
VVTNSTNPGLPAVVCDHLQAAGESRGSAYDVSFAQLCRGTHGFILPALSSQVNPGAHLLDVGTGTGRFAVRACLAGYQVTAVDPDACTSRAGRAMRLREPADAPLRE